MSPSKEGKLFHVVALDQGKDKPDESTTVERERDETVVLDQSSQKFLDNNLVIVEWIFCYRIKFNYSSVVDDAEIIDQTLAVEKVVGSD